METKDNKKQKIKDAAFNLFVNRGYDAMTIRMLCKESCVEAPTVYHYFRSKKGLFYAVIDDILSSYQKQLEESMRHWGEAPLDQIYGFYKFAVQYSMTHKIETRFYLRYRLFWPTELMEDIENHFLKLNESKSNMLSKAIIACNVNGTCLGDEKTAYQRLVNFIDSCTFNVIFSNWQPDDYELRETWQLFYENRIKSYANKSPTKEMS